MAYDLSQLKLEGIEIKNIINCQISQIPGEHGELSLTGYVENDKFEEVCSHYDFIRWKNQKKIYFVVY